MMPPDCFLCDKGLATGNNCELICFAKTESDHQWHTLAQSEAGLTGHPPECGWFCEQHLETVKSLTHLTISSALQHIRERESWHLIYIDLFDRETPPIIQRTGVGYESGFCEFWDHILPTTETDGRRYPSDYRLGFQCGIPDYSLPRSCPDLTLIKQNLPTAEEETATGTIKQLSISQAAALRTNGLPGAEECLRQYCDRLSGTQP